MPLNISKLLGHEGGSLNSIRAVTQIAKSYDGPVERGSEKLWREFTYLKNLPPEIAKHFPAVEEFHYDAARGWAELRLQRIPQPAFAKALLLKEITPARTAELLAAVLAFLTDELYPLGDEVISGPELYRQYHAGRMSSAVNAFGQMGAFSDLFKAPHIEVNGLRCPSLQTAVRWVDNCADRLFGGSHLVRAHGDLHLDNVLIRREGNPDFWLVDPRGEMLMPPHYDLAKLLKSLRSGYDLVHYGGYSIVRDFAVKVPTIELGIDSEFAAHYQAGMEVLRSVIPTYAELEGITTDSFVSALLAAEFVHVLSFAYYHANRPQGCDIPRVTAYLATASLLARDLMGAERKSLLEPLPIWRQS